MQIQKRRVETVTILNLKGKLTLGDGDALLRETVHALVKRGHKQLILDLADVSYIDSAGLGAIVATYTTVMRRRGSLKLLNVPKRIRDLLVITKLLSVFETFDGETEAVRAFLLPSDTYHIEYC